MTTEPELPDLDIVTPYGTITRLPTSFPITDPEIDAHLDPVIAGAAYLDQRQLALDVRA